MSDTCERARVFFTCLDWRLGEVPLARSTVYDCVAAMRKAYRGAHIRSLEPLGIRVLVAWGRDAGLVRRLAEGGVDADEAGVPEPYYLHSLTALPGGRLLAVYWLPPGVGLWRVREWAVESFEGRMIPVYNCLGVSGVAPSPLEEEQHVATLKRVLASRRVSVKTPLLAYVLVALLDVDPWLTLPRLRRIVGVLEARGLPNAPNVELRAKYAYKYYRLLSGAGVLGRVYTYRPGGLSFLVEAPASCLDHVYPLLAHGLYTYRVYLAGDRLVAGVYTHTPQETLRALVRACPEASVAPVLHSQSHAFPAEQYVPGEGWHPTGDSRVERLPQLLSKYGLLDRRKT